jgi:Ca2+-binding EF-hand superfamily protein
MLLSARNVQVVQELFQALDIHNNAHIDDIQFLAFMRSVTDLGDKEIYLLFDTFDVDCSGSIEFDEFYLLFCMLVAIKVCCDFEPKDVFGF